MRAISAVNCQIIRARTPEEIAAARELIQEYAASLPVNLNYQNFKAEIESFPGAYAEPLGALFLARTADLAAPFLGCVALRPHSVDVAELKRLYVRPSARGQNLGRLLTEAAIHAARIAGYRSICLDTLPSMTTALVLYHTLGFRPIPPYYPGSPTGTTFLGLTLEQPA
jgi:GNAT superfamily N-acetyltransferase